MELASVFPLGSHYKSGQTTVTFSTGGTLRISAIEGGGLEIAHVHSDIDGEVHLCGNSKSKRLHPLHGPVP